VFYIFPARGYYAGRRLLCAVRLQWAKPLVALSAEAERILGVTHTQLARCRSTDAVLHRLNTARTAFPVLSKPRTNALSLYPSACKIERDNRVISTYRR
jgi:hypothetical protein